MNPAQFEDKLLESLSPEVDLASPLPVDDEPFELSGNPT
jgi:hypothetical protein